MNATTSSGYSLDSLKTYQKQGLGHFPPDFPWRKMQMTLLK